MTKVLVSNNVNRDVKFSHFSSSGYDQVCHCSLPRLAMDPGARIRAWGGESICRVLRNCEGGDRIYRGTDSVELRDDKVPLINRTGFSFDTHSRDPPRIRIM